MGSNSRTIGKAKAAWVDPGLALLCLGDLMPRRTLELLSDIADYMRSDCEVRKLYALVESALSELVGFRLLTILRMEHAHVRRLHSSDPETYPAGGVKDISGDTCLRARGRQACGVQHSGTRPATLSRSSGNLCARLRSCAERSGHGCPANAGQHQPPSRSRLVRSAARADCPALCGAVGACLVCRDSGSDSRRCRIDFGRIAYGCLASQQPLNQVGRVRHAVFAQQACLVDVDRSRTDAE